MNIICCAIENEKPNARKEFWFRYYSKIMREFDAEYLIAISDGPNISQDYQIPVEQIDFSDPVSMWIKGRLNIVTFPEQLPARVDGSTYPRYYRSIWAAMTIGMALKVDRVLEIETDAWVYTPRMAKRLASHSRPTIGCGFSSRWGFPELMLATYPHALFAEVAQFIEQRTWADWAKPQPEIFEKVMEQTFPTTIWGDMIGDRYAEASGFVAPAADADFSVQDERVTIDRWRGKP